MEEEEEAEPGIQNQKQEPHTKMWGKTPSTTFNALECRANHWTLVSVVGHACKTPTCGTELYLYSKTWENTLVRYPWMTLS